MITANIIKKTNTNCRYKTRYECIHRHTPYCHYIYYIIHKTQHADKRHISGNILYCFAPLQHTNHITYMPANTWYTNPATFYTTFSAISIWFLVACPPVWIQSKWYLNLFRTIFTPINISKRRFCNLHAPLPNSVLTKLSILKKTPYHKANT